MSGQHRPAGRRRSRRRPVRTAEQGTRPEGRRIDPSAEIPVRHPADPKIKRRTKRRSTLHRMTESFVVLHRPESFIFRLFSLLRLEFPASRRSRTNRRNRPQSRNSCRRHTVLRHGCGAGTNSPLRPAPPIGTAPQTRCRHRRFFRFHRPERISIRRPPESEGRFRPAAGSNRHLQFGKPHGPESPPAGRRRPPASAGTPPRKPSRNSPRKRRAP